MWRWHHQVRAGAGVDAAKLHLRLRCRRNCRGGRMRDTQQDGLVQRDGEGLTLLAASVVARLVSRDAKADQALNEAMLGRMMAALIGPDPCGFDALLPDLKRARISHEDLADHYFPAIARRLGCDWADDRMSFVTVTIGSARMQGILRGIGAAWSGDEEGGPRAAGTLLLPGTLLLVVPRGEQHSLGAMVLLGQLRRRGVSVSLRLGPSSDELRLLLRHQVFQAAMVSVACVEKVELCREIVATMRRATEGRMPVAVGGAVLLQDTAALQHVGATIATNDLTAALTALGMTTPVEAREHEYG